MSNDVAQADIISSRNGSFTTSLKGTRALLRKRGRRAEVVVGRMEKAIRAWLAGDSFRDDRAWNVVDDTLVEAVDGDERGMTASGSRLSTLDARVSEILPAYPLTDGQISAVLELSRSPTHLSWAVADRFDRLVLHILARYYELASFSASGRSLAKRHAENPGEDRSCSERPNVRLTHLIRPTLTRRKTPRADLSPDQSITDLSASDTFSALSGTSHLTDATTVLSESDYVDLDVVSEYAESEVESVQGYSLDPDVSNTTIVPAQMARAGSHASDDDQSEWESLEGSVMSLGVTANEPVAVTWHRGTTDFGAALHRWEAKPTFFDYLYGE